MKVITAVENYTPDSNDVKLFLGGGITNCRDWQSEVIEKLQNRENHDNLHNLVVFNPRRPNFPIDDPNASFEQINWEFNYLMLSDIFSMFFCQDTESDQPICMYELGRYIPIKLDQRNKIVITSEPNYKRIKDVEIQCKLALNNNSYQINYDLNQHIDAIINAYNTIIEDRRIIKNSNKSDTKQITKSANKNDINKFIQAGTKTNVVKESTSSNILMGLNLQYYNNMNTSGMIFENKTFVDCDFNNSVLYNTKYKNCKFNKCNFNNAVYHDVLFEDCEIGFSSFINTKGLNFKNSKKIQCEEAENIDMTFSLISKFLEKDNRFTKLEDGVYKVDIPEYSLLNILVMRNDEISGDSTNPQCDIALYITPVSDNIKQITPLFVTYDFDTIADLFKADDFCNNLISDIIQTIDMKYKPVLKSAIDQLKQITDGDK